MTKYILRFDDITPEFLTTQKWYEMNEFLKKFELKVILGVIPFSKDKNLEVNGDREKGIKILKNLYEQGHLIAIHGCHHDLEKIRSKSLVPINKYGEFAGKSKRIQYILLKKAHSWFINNGIIPNAWMAPAHSFDEITIECLKELQINVISDGLFIGPRLRKGMIWIPQQIWQFKKFPFGCWTICVHLLEINHHSLLKLKSSIENNLRKFINPSIIVSDSYLIKNYSNFDNNIQNIALSLINLKKNLRTFKNFLKK